jgi:hypothetical protein
MEKERRVRSTAYLRHVRQSACLNCRSPYPSAHHLQFPQQKIMGVKSGYEYAVPLCHKCHMELHAYGNERLWWALRGIDALAWARDSYRAYHAAAVKRGRV